MIFENKVNGNPLIATLDHVVPVSKGGTNAYTNLKLACAKCNNERDF